MNKLDGINLEFNFNLFFEFRYVQHVSTYMIVIFFIKKKYSCNKLKMEMFQ